MAVVAVGDFDVDSMEAKVNQHFAPPPEGEANQELAAVGPSTDRPSTEIPVHETPWIEVFTDAESPIRICQLKLDVRRMWSRWTS